MSERQLERISWTATCSGCYEGGEYDGNAHLYPFDKQAGCRVGSGCRECGYTGKRRRVDYIPRVNP